MRSGNPVTRALSIEERADGQVKIEVQMMGSPLLRGMGPKGNRGSYAPRTWWILRKPDLIPAHTWMATGAHHARDLYQPLSILLGQVEATIEAERKRLPPDELTDARQRIAVLEAEVASLKKRRRGRGRSK